MTSPLTPQDCDLRDFPAMLMEISRLFNSEFHALAGDAEWRAGVTLWLKSFHQVPAGSLPTNDAALARLSELGADVKKWKKIKQSALRGWYECDDGRLYHNVVGEKVLEAWIEKLTQRLSSGAGNARRWGTPFDEQPVVDAIYQAREMLKALNPESRTLKKKPPKAAIWIPGGSPGGIPDGNPEDCPSDSQEKGREGKGNKNPLSTSGDNDDDGRRAETTSSSSSHPPADPITSRAVELAILLRHRGASVQHADPNVRQWAADGVTDAQALAALELAQSNRAKTRSVQPINSGYLNSIISEARLTPVAAVGRPQVNRQQALEDRNRAVAADWATKKREELDNASR